jgi:hypothetical protein
MPLTRIPLLNIVADLMRQPELRQRLNRNPMAVIKEYGLDTAPQNQLAAFLTMNPVEIGRKLQALMGQAEMEPGDFPPPSEDFFQKDGGIDPAYPSPRPGIFRIRPRRISVAEITNNAFEFVVYGQSFVNTKLTLKRTSDGAEANLTHEHLIGTFRGSVLRAVVRPPGGMGSFSAGEKYRVVVMNNPGAGPPYEEDVGGGAALLLEIT